MADKIRVELDNATDAGAAEVQQNLDKIGNSADALTADLHQAARAADKVEDELHQATKSAKQLAAGGTDVGSMLGKLAGGAIAIAAVKAAIQGTLQAVKSLSDQGSPAFVELQGSIDGALSSLTQLAESPEVQNLAAGLADSINNTLIPAIRAIPDAWRDFNANNSRRFAELGEQIGLFAEGTREANEEMIGDNERLLQQQQEQIRQRRIRIAVDENLAKIDAKLAADESVAIIGQIQDQAELLRLLERKTATLRDQAGSAERDRNKEAQELREIEAIKKRLQVLPKEQAEAERKAAEDAQKASDAAYQQQVAEYQKMQDERVRIAMEAEQRITDQQRKAAEERLAILRAEHEERVRLIEQADGGKLLDQARKAIDPRAVRAQIAEQRGQQAAEQFTRERAGDLDASDAAAVRRFRAQREVARQQAERAAAQQFNRGQVSSDEIGQAQNALIQSAAHQAVASGNLSEAMGRALIEAANNQQAMTERLNRQEQQIQQVTRALQGVGQSNASARQRAISGGFRR